MIEGSVTGEGSAVLWQEVEWSRDRARMSNMCFKYIESFFIRYLFINLGLWI